MKNKLKTKSHFEDFLDSELAWRVKEIADIRSALSSAEETSMKSLVRAGIPILYAHWEGFIKASSEGLFNFINNQGLSYKSLQSCYIAAGLRRLINQVLESGNPSDSVAVVDFFMNDIESRATLIGKVRTEYNLSSVVFEQIARSVGVNVEPYETKFVLIDKSLVDRRNNIAHGQHLDVNPTEFRSLSQDVIALMRRYKDDLSNIVAAEAFKRA